MNIEAKSGREFLPSAICNASVAGVAALKHQQRLGLEHQRRLKERVRRRQKLNSVMQMRLCLLKVPSTLQTF
jgi:hypothetical protein